jgi:NTP pyrophosphatase (non-canonical NTP hydrolase)
MTDIDLQRTVFEAVRARGYLQGAPSAEIRQQVLKAVEELGEVARCVFDGRAVPVAELADVVIPLLNIAQLQGDDLLAAVLDKALRDRGRGVRSVRDGVTVCVRCRRTGEFYPAPDGGGGWSYAAAGDIIHVTPAQAEALLRLEWVEALE